MYFDVKFCHVLFYTVLLCSVLFTQLALVFISVIFSPYSSLSCPYLFSFSIYKDLKTDCYKTIIDNVASARPGVLELMDAAIADPRLKVI